MLQTCPLPILANLGVDVKKTAGLHLLLFWRLELPGTAQTPDVMNIMPGSRDVPLLASGRSKEALPFPLTI